MEMEQQKHVTYKSVVILNFKSDSLIIIFFVLNTYVEFEFEN